MNTTRIVIVGAGFGGVYTYIHLHRLLHGRTGVHLTLISRTNYFLFTPLLHEVATGGISPENIIQPIREVMGCCVDSFVCAEVRRISFKKREVETALGTTPYDLLVLAPGAETNFFGAKGAREHAFTLKDLEDAIRLKNHIVSSIESAAAEENLSERKRLLTFAVIGGGATGVELACELSDFVYGSIARYYPRALIRDHVTITLVQSGATLVPQFPPALQELSRVACEKKGISLRLNCAVESVEKGAIVLCDGSRIPTKSPIWVAGVKPASISYDDKAVCDTRGRLCVADTLQMKNYENVFVLGDSAAIEGVSIPLLAQVATQQAPIVAANIVAILEKKPLRHFSYRHLGTLISLGDFTAAGQIGNLVFSGMFCWWLWRTIYVSKMPTFRKKAKVIIDWTFDLFLPRDISRIE